jgi:secondary thiamine-phosphate synthase enzyme
MSRLAPDGDPMFSHTAEGPDDMSAHVRSVLTHNDLTVPIRNSRIDLGTWQGIYLWEHRTAPNRRSVTLTLNGE